MHYTHDSIKIPSTCTTFAAIFIDETFASLAQVHPGSQAFNVLLNKLDRIYGSKPNANILNRIQSSQVACGTAYSEYLLAYRFHVIELMTGDTMHHPLAGAVVEAVRDALHWYFYTMRLLLFTGATANDRCFMSLNRLWRHLDTYLYTILTEYNL